MVTDAYDDLVNNAGFGLWKPLEATTMAEWDHTFAVNVRAAAYLCAAVGQVVPRASRGSYLRVDEVVDVAGSSSAWGTTSSSARRSSCGPCATRWPEQP